MIDRHTQHEALRKDLAAEKVSPPPRRETTAERNARQLKDIPFALPPFPRTRPFPQGDD